MAKPKKKLRDERDRLAPSVKAYRWWVAWGTNAVIVTARNEVEAAAMVRGLGYFGPLHVYSPKVKVVRATRRHLELYDPEYYSAEVLRLSGQVEEYQIDLDAS